MTPMVMDASAAISIVRDEAAGPVFASIATEQIRLGGRIVVPSHFWLEIANSLRRRHHWSGRAIVGAVHRIDLFDPLTVDVDRAHLLLAIDLMERHGLSSYDAAYLVLAQSLGATLLTFDGRLTQVAGPLAVPLPDDHRLGEGRVAYLTDRETRPTWPDYSGLSAFLSKLRADAIRDREAIRR